jgi:hypothetical protein
MTRSTLRTPTPPRAKPPTSLLKRVAIPISVIGIVFASATLYRSALQKRSLDKRASRKDYPNPLWTTSNDLRLLWSNRFISPRSTFFPSLPLSHPLNSSPDMSTPGAPNLGAPAGSTSSSTSPASSTLPQSQSGAAAFDPKQVTVIFVLGGPGAGELSSLSPI